MYKVVQGALTTDWPSLLAAEREANRLSCHIEDHAFVVLKCTSTKWERVCDYQSGYRFPSFNFDTMLASIKEA